MNSSSTASSELSNDFAQDGIVNPDSIWNNDFVGTAASVEIYNAINAGGSGGEDSTVNNPVGQREQASADCHIC